MLLTSLAASTLLLLASPSIASPAARQLNQDITISAPDSYTTCTEVTISWTGGVAPYTVGIYKSDGGLYLDYYQNETSVTWLVDAAGGKEVNVQIIGSSPQGDFGSTPNTPVVNGTDVSCVKCAGYDGYQYC